MKDTSKVVLMRSEACPLYLMVKLRLKREDERAEDKKEQTQIQKKLFYFHKINIHQIIEIDD